MRAHVELRTLTTMGTHRAEATGDANGLIALIGSLAHVRNAHGAA
jgi:hypothetical protein